MWKNPFLTVLLLLTAILGGGKAYIDHWLNNSIANTLNTNFPQANIRYQQAHLSITGAIQLENLTIDTPTLQDIHITQVTLYRVYQWYNPQQLPENAQIHLSGLQIPLNDAAPPIPVWLNLFGYAPYYVTPTELRRLGYLSFNADVDIQAIRQTEQQIRLQALIDGGSWGKLQLQTTLENVPPPAQLQRSAQQIALAELTLSFSEQGLLKQLWGLWAQRNDTTIDLLQEKLIQTIQTGLAQTKLPFDASLMQSLRRFIQNPTHLRLSLKPMQALSLNKMLQIPLTDLVQSLRLMMDNNTFE
ncbi:hypothetical protein [Beggiatoa leptomitoformis]|uniref:DUF945 family protein n=1 Tax=Beggiatoa leptomitoformis TaxID=288004 RepID=A0A2N9YFT3_9GAMM|nr:hypothetical protein [Beggiatoa leptomitoformis]ALG68439.1 hypothetical protein AL038_12960 [Beggiatoa leptomitoformis]AUI69229.1 hypothetical protein BLE401_11310 [Beggiatoa leptomitoformis]